MSPILEILGAHPEGRCFYSLPEVDTIWVAKDGRRMRITKITHSQYVPGGWWADLYVLPPYQHRQRRRTRANAETFSSGFYTPEEL